MVPTFTADRSTGEAPSFSPAASPWVRRSPSPWPPCRSRSSVTRSRPSRTHPGVRCDPAHIHQVGAGSGLEGVRPLVPATRTPSRLACRTRAVWQCRPVPSLSGLLPPSPATPGSGCPQLHQAAATAQGRGPFIPSRSNSASWRTSRYQQTQGGVLSWPFSLPAEIVGNHFRAGLLPYRP